MLGSDRRLISSNPTERVCRVLVIGFFVAPILFVTVELSPTAWAIAITAALVAVHPRGAIVQTFPVPARLILMLCGLAGLSALWSVSPARSLHAAMIMVSFLVFGLLLLAQIRNLSFAETNRIWISLETGCVIGIIYLCSFEIFAYITSPQNVMPTAIIRTLHKTALYGALFAAVLMYVGDKTRLAAVLLIFALPTVLLSKTSGIILTIAFVAALYLPARKIHRPLFTAMLAAYVIISLAAPFVILPLYDTLAAFGAFDISQKFGSFVARLELWRFMDPYILDATWIGHGADTTRTFDFKIVQPKYYDLPDVPSAHNAIFDLWFELGAAGVSIFLAMLCSLAQHILRLPAQPGFMAMIVFLAMLIEFSVDHRIWLSWAQGAAVFAAGVSALCIQKNRFQQNLTQSATALSGTAAIDRDTSA